jgi:hypothetical protein
MDGWSGVGYLAIKRIGIVSIERNVILLYIHIKIFLKIYLL